jgi:S-adenosylmethionine:tRNA ribosyltransferase-isomerase
MTPSPSSTLSVPAGREADRAPEERGLRRDEVRLLLSTPEEDTDHRFRDLTTILRPGDLLVVNESATLPASLPARGAPGDFILNLSTSYGDDLWLAEPRWGPGTPGPLPLAPGDPIETAGIIARWVAGYPGISRLGFLRVPRGFDAAIARFGRPIRYGYMAREYPLATYQTIFARVPGSAEMPSAGRPFSERLRRALEKRGVRFAPIVLHAGVSSLEVDPAQPAAVPIYPEPFFVPRATTDAIERAHRRCGRVIAVGTTVVRALESATDDGTIHPLRGFTGRYISPARPVTSVGGLLTGFHTATSTHVAMLAGFFGVGPLSRAYRAAVDRGYLWHEFGDSHLLLRSEERG